MKGMKERGFTLIELLIVVAIIGILAAIAIPNFLQAQTRAKVARAQSDMKTLQTAAEMYYVDRNAYPPQTFTPPTGYPSFWFTSPIDYISNKDLRDPFNESGWVPPDEIIYSYHVFAYRPTMYGPNHVDCYGKYRFMSYGPDRGYWGPGPGEPGFAWNNQHVLYDPTNGTTSDGNIFCCQKYPSLKRQYDITLLQYGM